MHPQLTRGSCSNFSFPFKFVVIQATKSRTLSYKWIHQSIRAGMFCGQTPHWLCSSFRFLSASEQESSWSREPESKAQCSSQSPQTAFALLAPQHQVKEAELKKPSFFICFPFSCLPIFLRQQPDSTDNQSDLCSPPRYNLDLGEMQMGEKEVCPHLSSDTFSENLDHRPGGILCFTI